ncbi:Rpn family recombination-promoting nuclease/putative transposase [Pantoea sp. LMR881]|uniref:Rpn family recombination-promoting nuclease/putative transposase n=1 Tax=Pantoea sp. LMR881 TaxID=3014336 RepID=UPI0022AFB991|nr:Rpn family recombination-promoting nuclease/putative transposase [Pantoea sp. LMR881]MCZ4061093.1 Rpn family recombination-promoting nuclease/putative transposase [Pantoea sp. LMR881]
MKSNSTPTPHDAVFKTFLSHPQTARDFMALHLPPALLTICDLSTLRLESGSFVEDDLRPYYSDVLYSLKTNKGDGYVHVLIEHQSSPDRHMAFRMMRYAVAAMQRHLDAGHQTLPLVIPVLFYQGKRSPYPYSMNWLQLFSKPETAATLYSDGFPLVDVTIIPDEEIMQHHSMAALTLLQKHIRQQDLKEVLDQLALLMASEFMTGQQLHALVNYILQAGETADAGAFIRELAQRVPQHEDELMTIAQQLEQKGRQEGRLEGLREGVQEASLKIARNLLENGMDIQSVMNVTGLTEEDLKQARH